MKPKLRNTLSLFGLTAFLICALLFAYYPAIPRTLLGWAALIFLGLPVWFFLEWLGGAVLQSRFFSRLSSPMRVLVAIPVVILLMVFASFLIKLVQQLIAS